MINTNPRNWISAVQIRYKHTEKRHIWHQFSSVFWQTKNKQTKNKKTTLPKMSSTLEPTSNKTREATFYLATKTFFHTHITGLNSMWESKNLSSRKCILVQLLYCRSLLDFLYILTSTKVESMAIPLVCSDKSDL